MQSSALVLALAACGGSHPPAAPPPAAGSAVAPAPPAAPPSFTLQDVTVRHDGATLAPGAELHSRDRFEILVDLSAPAYIYVVRVAPGTKAQSVLYPASTAKQLPAGTSRVPSDPRQIFQLDDQTGTEHLYVVATARDLEHGADAINEAVRSIEDASPPDPVEAPKPETPAAPTPPTPPKPMMRPKKIESKPITIADRMRDVVVVSIDGGGVCSGVPSNATGVAACRFTIKHR